jgi:hypothetical protein
MAESRGGPKKPNKPPKNASLGVECVLGSRDLLSFCCPRGRWRRWAAAMFFDRRQDSPSLGLRNPFSNSPNCLNMFQRGLRARRCRAAPGGPADRPAIKSTRTSRREKIGDSARNTGPGHSVTPAVLQLGRMRRQAPIQRRRAQRPVAGTPAAPRRRGRGQLHSGRALTRGLTQRRRVAGEA